MSQKRNLIKNLAFRIRKICSTEFITSELDFLKNVLIKNGYPEAFIDSNLKEKRQQPNNENTLPNKTVFVSVPFKGDIPAEVLKRRLNKVIQNKFNDVILRVGFKSTKLITVNPKTQLSSLAQSHIIYLYKCNNCSMRYVGRTTRKLEIRIKEHLKINCSNETLTAIGNHVLTSNHTSNHSNFNILYRATNERDLRIAEAIFCKLLSPELNVQKRFVKELQIDW